MAQNKGKQFESRFRQNWLETVDDSVCYRLYDVQAGFKGVSNVGDFLCYKYPNFFIIDCKSKKGGTLPFSDIRQYEKMLEYKGISGVYTGVIIWFYEKDIVCWVPIETLEQIYKEGKKSFNIKMLDDHNYKCYNIPSKKLRTFMNTDYLELVRYCNGESAN